MKDSELWDGKPWNDEKWEQYNANQAEIAQNIEDEQAQEFASSCITRFVVLFCIPFIIVATIWLSYLFIKYPVR